MNNPVVAPKDTKAKLRDTLALNRMMEFVGKYEFKGTSQASIVAHIEAKFPQIQRYLYQDTVGSEEHKNGRNKAAHREQTREAIVEFVSAMYTPTGFVKRQDTDESLNKEKLVEAFATFYKKLNDIDLFNGDTQRVIDTLVVCLTHTPAFKEVHNLSIDFRRLDADALAELNMCKNEEKIKIAFNQAFDDALTPHLDNGIAPDSQEELKTWPDKRIYIAGIPFLQHEEKEQKYLVTVNGGLVPHTEALEQDIKSKLVDEGRLFDELDGIQPTSYLPLKDKNGKDIETQKNGVVDGFEVKDGKAPLLCLDASIITGLRPAHHEEFEEFWKAQIKDIATRLEGDGQGSQERIKKAVNAGWTRFADERYADALKDLTNGDQHLRKICEVATKHIKAVVAQMDIAKEKEMAGKTTVSDPLLVMSMGGAGSGKGGAKTLIFDAVEENFITASLDDYRDHSTIYRVFQAVKHHADDYALVEPYANTLRNWVRQAAMEGDENGRYNLLYDGTAIPLSRCEDILKDAKSGSQPYHVVIAGYDTLLHVPDAQKSIVDGTAVDRVVKRQQGDEKRALPWPVVSAKHIGTLSTMMEALSDKRVDRLLMFCKDGVKGQDYLLADIFTVDKNQAAKVGTSLQDFKLLRERANPEFELRLKESIAEACKNAVPFPLDDNCSKLTKRVGDTHRVMLINNNYRFIQLAEKGLMNPHASMLGGLLQKHAGMAADVPDAVEKGHTNKDISLMRLPEQYVNHVREVIMNAQAVEYATRL